MRQFRSSPCMATVLGHDNSWDHYVWLCRRVRAIWRCDVGAEVSCHVVLARETSMTLRTHVIFDSSVDLRVPQ